MRRGRKRKQRHDEPSREGVEAELPQPPATETVPEPQPIGGRRGPRRQIEQRED